MQRGHYAGAPAGGEDETTTVLIKYVYLPLIRRYSFASTTTPPHPPPGSDFTVHLLAVLVWRAADWVEANRLSTFLTGTLH